MSDRFLDSWTLEHVKEMYPELTDEEAAVELAEIRSMLEPF